VRFDEAGEGAVGVVPGEPLRETTRPRLHEVGAESRGAGLVEVGAPEQRGELLPPGRRRGVGDHDGALALAEVADRRLPRLGLGAEDAEHVVDELVRDPDLAAELAERRDGLLGRPREDAARLERTLERVHGRLEPLHREDVVDVRVVGVEGEVDVDELAGGAREERVVHDLEQAGARRPRDAGAVDEAVGVEQCEVARDDGGADPVVLGGGLLLPGGEGAVLEDPRHVGDAAPHEVPVDDVVVHAKGGVEEFERGTDAGRGLAVRATERLVGGEHHAGSEPLAAGRRGLDGVPECEVRKP